MAVQAVASTAVYAGTSVFPIAKLVLAVALVCHHVFVH
jgi:hypothetical protein